VSAYPWRPISLAAATFARVFFQRPDFLLPVAGEFGRHEFICRGRAGESPEGLWVDGALAGPSALSRL
jgi:hypothetical protein